jgi:hypothetical protein
MQITIRSFYVLIYRNVPHDMPYYAVVTAIDGMDLAVAFHCKCNWFRKEAIWLSIRHFLSRRHLSKEVSDLQFQRRLSWETMEYELSSSHSHKILPNHLSEHWKKLKRSNRHVMWIFAMVYDESARAWSRRMVEAVHQHTRLSDYLWCDPFGILS